MVCVSFLAYSIDMFFGEFPFIKHPIIYIGELIEFFEDKFYKDSVRRGLLLVLFVLSIVAAASFSISLYLAELNVVVNSIITAIIASMFLAHKMLHDSVKNILEVEDKKEAISMLVSRDTKDMSESDVYKAGIETYAENLSDGVIAPLFYLSIFGLVGIVVYKAVNTMDSMVGYKNQRYEKYGKIAAKLDDILNFIPSRITAVLIMLINKQRDIFGFYKDGKKHDSPNAGHPITAMALALGVKLGGDTSYFGKLKTKAYFGDGKAEICTQDLEKALSMKKKIDLVVLVVLSLICMEVLI
jgi:adenosylcobinamide-phosphate synthase